MRRGLIKAFQEAIGRENVLTSPADRECYSYDASGLASMPDMVVLPQGPEAVSKVLVMASDARIPIVPRGAGSGTAGGSVPALGGIVVSLARMNRILSIRPDDLTVDVEPGAITGDIQKAVEEKGLFYPPDPASLAFCTIGGNVSTGAGGPRAVKYGVTKDYVVSLEVGLAGGDIIRTGTKTAKNAVGYDLTRLMTGSEGTLGIVTGITLKLLPLPEETGTAIAIFSDPRSAVRSVTALFEAGLLPRCAEFLDARCIHLVRDLLPPMPDATSRALLLMEVDGDAASVKRELSGMQEILRPAGAVAFHLAVSKEEATAFWRARRGLSPAMKRLGLTGKVSEDICVPRHALPDMLDAIEQIDSSATGTIVTFGHAGDGNLHVNILFDAENENAKAETGRTAEEILDAAVRLGGTISGEHGVGLSKRPYVEKELGPETLGIMKGIKAAFDPWGIMNPGKVFP